MIAQARAMMRGRRTVSLAFAFLCLVSPPLTYAGEQPAHGVPSVVRQAGFERLNLRDAVAHEVRRQASWRQRTGAAQTLPPVPVDRGWMKRHPAAFGALVGAGAGAVSAIPQWNELYCAGGGDEDCFFHGAAGVAVGAGIGAGIGALVGMIAGR